MNKWQTSVPCHVVHRSKIVQGPGSLGDWGIERDATLSLTAGMLGGSGIPGDWHCAKCNRGGCRHTKAWCFRCGISRAESEAILRGSAQGFSRPSKGSGKGKGVGKGGGSPPQREQSYPGRLAPTSGAQFFQAPRSTLPLRTSANRRTLHLLSKMSCSKWLRFSKCWAALKTFWTRRFRVRRRGWCMFSK